MIAAIIDDVVPAAAAVFLVCAAVYGVCGR